MRHESSLRRLWVPAVQRNAFPCSKVFHTMSFPPFFSPAFSNPAYWSCIFQSRIFHPCILVPHFPVLHFPPSQSGAAFSSPGFSCLVIAASPYQNSSTTFRGTPLINRKKIRHKHTQRQTTVLSLIPPHPTDA